MFQRVELGKRKGANDEYGVEGIHGSLGNAYLQDKGGLEDSHQKADEDNKTGQKVTDKGDVELEDDKKFRDDVVFSRDLAEHVKKLKFPKA